MHVTLHLTNACNLACGYCYECHQKDYMTAETAKKGGSSGSRERAVLLRYRILRRGAPAVQGGDLPHSCCLPGHGKCPEYQIPF